MVSHLIDGQDPRADHLSFSGDKRGHDQTWAVTEAQAWLHIQGLQYMFKKNSYTLGFLLDVTQDMNSYRKDLRVVLYLKVLSVSRSGRNRHLLVP